MASHSQSRPGPWMSFCEQLLISHSGVVVKADCGLRRPCHCVEMMLNCLNLTSKWNLQIQFQCLNGHVTDVLHQWVLSNVDPRLDYCSPIHRKAARNMAKHCCAMFEEPPAPDWSHKWNVSLGVWPACRQEWANHQHSLLRWTAQSGWCHSWVVVR